MNDLYHVEGILNRGFVGQITYMVCLEKTYSKLDIHFSFDKRTYSEEEVTPELIREVTETIRENYGLEYSEQRAKDTLATLNDEFIGCIHKQLDDRHMLYDGDTASDGCIPQEKIDGVLKVTVLVFNVIKDNTRYSLTVSGE